jgi:nuclear transcription factor Y gamma
MDNSGCSIYTDIAELNHTKLEITHIANSTYGINLEATFNVDDGQQQHMGDEPSATNHMHVVHGELDAEVVTTTNVSAGDNNINWDEIDMASDSMLIEFWKDAMVTQHLYRA